MALVAAAGPLRDPRELEESVENARALGWEPVPGAHVLARHGYLAGPDEHRLADVNAALADDTIDGVWFVRGGYGSMRLLASLDYDALRRRPKVMLGFSDITAIHAAVATRCDVVTYHGPTARGALSRFSRRSLARAVMEARDPCGIAPAARTLRSGRAEGPLVGGNLSLIAALAGTPYAPDYSGAILVLEDVGEPTYRIDRMLQQLLMSGALSGLAGIAIGEFSEGTPSHDVMSRKLDDVLRDMAELAGVPAVAGIPLGHIDDQWTLPLGARAALDADAHTLRVQL